MMNRVRCAFGRFRVNLRDAAAAIDLASIIIGVVVLAVLGAIIAGSVLIALPWAHNEQAKGDLAEVDRAQSLYQPLNLKYGDYTDLRTAKMLADGQLDLCVTKAPAGDGFTAVRKSVTGMYYQRTETSTTAVKVTKAAFDTCAASSTAMSSAAPDTSPVLAMTLDTNLASCLTFQLPVRSSGAVPVNVSVDWGDGSPVQAVTADMAPHTFSAPSTVQKVTVTGTFGMFGLNGQTWLSTKSTECIKSVDRWGSGTQAIAANTAFYRSKITSVPTPPATLTDMTGMFREATLFNQDVSGWDTSKVTNMSSMFQGIPAFTNGGKPLVETAGSWSTANVLYFDQMFRGATLFNQDVSGWDTSKAVSFWWTFHSATAFDNGGQPLPQVAGKWSVSNVTSLAGMFDGTKFNQNVSSWDTSKVTDMRGMFVNANSFANGGQPLPQVAGRWDTSRVVYMNDMFAGTKFNQDVSSWDTSKVINMGNMFNSAIVFDNGGQPLPQVAGRWSTALVWNTTMMFYNAQKFNQNISSWDTSKVSGMSSMFAAATLFNNGGQPLPQVAGRWSTANSTSTNSMFNNAPAFNQDISSWDTSKVSDMGNMFNASTAFNNGGQPLTVGAGRWNTAQVTSSWGMDRMFNGATSFTRNLSSWPISFSGTPASFGVSGANAPVWY